MRTIHNDTTRSWAYGEEEMLADSPARMTDGVHRLSLTPIMTTASTPATPGPSTPTTVRTLPIDQAKDVDMAYSDDFAVVPPDRPQSTPQSNQESVKGDSQRLQLGSEYLVHLNSFEDEPKPECAKALLYDLPTEIHECILDHLFGVRASTASRTTTSPGKTKILRSWGSALRHSRRREVSDLARVCKNWRVLVQERLYRHLKIKGTRESLNQATDWFSGQPHLCSYVKHVEIWFPVFQQKNPTNRTLRIPPASPATNPDRAVHNAALADPGNMVVYQSPSNNCSLDQVFWFIRTTFAEACVLTLEGGERKKPPMVQHFSTTSGPGRLPIIESVRTLVCKGQWNLIRCNENFQDIVKALPNLNEWHGLYAKPKSKSYLTMATILPNLPKNLTHLNLCLEADYRREAVSPMFSRKVANQLHFCVEMAKSIPTLEHLGYTGRVCHAFFDHAAKLSCYRDSRLKSVDIIVKNVCRLPAVWNDGSGIQDMSFITSFEKLVVSGIKSLDRLAAVKVLKIRFIDLESQVPSLNPYFQLAGNEVTGIWSEPIIDCLLQTRPAARFSQDPGELSDIGFKEGQLLTTPSFSKARPLSIKVASYLSLTGGITIT